MRTATGSVQGKRHQQNLAKRAAMEARDTPVQPAPKTVVQPRKTVKIGKPGYRVSKLYDPELRQRHMLFQVRCFWCCAVFGVMPMHALHRLVFMYAAAPAVRHVMGLCMQPLDIVRV